MACSIEGSVDTISYRPGGSKFARATIGTYKTAYLYPVVKLIMTLSKNQLSQLDCRQFAGRAKDRLLSDY